MRIGEFSTKFKIGIKLFLLGLFFTVPYSGVAQYDYEHYVPPFYDGSFTNNDIGYHRAILSTNSVKEITVHIYRGYDDEIGTVTISNTSPHAFRFKTLKGTGVEKGRIIAYPHTYTFPENVVGAKELNKVLADDGLRFYSSDGPFFVNMRHSTKDQGSSLTTKGTYAYGTEFLSGHGYTHKNSDTSRRSHFISVMATEDNTEVRFTDIKVSRLTEFDSGTNSLKPKLISPTDVISVNLMRGQSYIIGVDHDLPGFSLADMNAMNGTSVTSTKPIVMNTGSWTTGGANGQDICVDQIVPIDQVRKEYITIRGKGSATTECTIIVATEDNTSVKVNGVQKGTIAKKGGHLVLYDQYDGNGNAFIDASKDVYVYQTLSGSNTIIDPTVGMNFIPPVSTSGIREVTVPYADYLAVKDVKGVITILVQTNAVVSYSKNGEETLHPISKITTAPVKVADHPEWEIYKLTEMSGDYRFYANKAINVAWLVESIFVGAAGYYSGFTKAISVVVPDLDVDPSADLDLICESYEGDISVSIKEPLPDFYEWYVNDFNSAPIIENGPLVVPAPDVETTYYVVGSYRDPDMDQLFNGSFFEKTVDTDYDEVHGRLQLPGEYCTVRQTTDADPSFKDPSPFTDLDNDYMFMAISKDKGDTLYRGTPVDVVDGFNYIVKLYGRSVTNSVYTEPQNLRIQVNDDVVVDNFRIDDVDNWKSVSALWKPGGDKNAIVKILNNNPSGESAVFALDSITFVQSVQDTAQFVARVVPNYSYDDNGGKAHFCTGVSGTIDISHGDTSWYTYSWSKKESDGTYTDLEDGDQFSGTKTFEIGFKNPQKSDEGYYRCVIGFKPEYQECGSSESTANVDISVHIDDEATVKIEADKTNFCDGENATLNALVTGDPGDIKWYVDGGTSPVSLENPFVFKYPAGTHTVRCETENGCNIAEDQITINVLSSPDLVSLTSNDNLCVGENIIVTALATGDGTLVYTWQKDSETLSETGSVLNYKASILDRESTFKVMVKSVYTIADKTVECINGSGKAVFNLNIIPLVEFDKLLSNATVCEGDNHSFNVTMKYPGDFYEYTWSKDGVDVDNSLSSLNLAGVTPAKDQGEYKVVVTGKCNSEFSVADLIVTPAIKVNGFGTDKTGPFCAASDVTATFDVESNGANYIYQVVEPGGTPQVITNPYTFNVNAGNVGDWQFLVSSDCDEPVSFDVSLNMLQNFGALTLNDIGTCLGENVTFKAEVADVPASLDLHYVWTDNLGNPIGTDSEELPIVNVQDVNLGDYTVTVTDQCGNTKTATATLSKEAVTSPINTTTTTLCEGDDFTSTIAYLGNPTFQWRYGDPVTGTDFGTTETLHISGVTVADAGIYYCTVELVCGTSVTVQRKLVVNKHIAIVNGADETLHFCNNEKPLLEIEVSGDPADYTIEWKDAGGTTLRSGSFIQLDAHPVPGTYLYTARVTGLCETLEKKFFVTIHEQPSLTEVDPIVACEGDIPLSVTVVGADFDKVEWWNANESTKLGEGTNYTIVGATNPDSEGTYVAKVVSDYCLDVKTSILVSIYEPVSITSTSDLNPTPCLGEPLSLVVNAVGDGIEYKWYETSTPGVTLSTENTLDLGTADVSDNNSYTCEVISVNGCGNKSVVFTVAVREHVAITSQPVDLTICASVSPADFTVTATGDGTLTYQWFDKDDNPVGGNSSTLSIANPAANDGQNYYCIVSATNCDSKKSDVANLLVKEEVTITDHPDNIKIADGGNATFSVSATGDPTLTYLWQVSDNGGASWTNVTNAGLPAGTSYSGITSSTLTLTNALLSFNGHQYRSIVDNGCTPVTSSAAVLTVDAAAKITAQPQNFDACVGDVGKSFVIEASGAGLTFTWEYRQNSGDAFGPISGGMSLSNGDKTLTLPKITLEMNTWEFRCTVSGTGSPDVSNIVKANVFQPITFDPIDNVTLCTGIGAHFEASNISGSGSYNYTWKKGGLDISTDSQLSLSAANATDGNYSVTVDNGVCPATTDDFSIAHYTDLTLNPWTNVSESCVGENPADVLEVTTATADGALSLSYEWTKDNDPTPLSTNSTYELPGLSKTESGLYKVEVSDGCSTQSISGFVNVYDPIKKINTWDASLTQCIGTNLILDVKVTGYNPTYVWTVPNGARPSVGNVSNLKFNNLTLADAGTYTCTVTGNCGTPVVYTTELTILEVPVITRDLDDVIIEVCENDPLIIGPIEVTGTHNNPVWTLNDNVTQVTTTGLSLDLGTADLTEAGDYKVTVSNMCGEDVSLGHQVVNSMLKLDPIEDQTVCQGYEVVFRANATGSGLIYQWLVDGVPTGGNSSELIINGAQVQPTDPNTSKTYAIECKISSTTGCGTANQTASLLVKPGIVLHATLKNVVKYVGESHSMMVDVTGVDLKFEWTFEPLTGGKIPLAENGPQIDLTNIQLTDAGYYTCRITGSCGQRLASGKLIVKEPVKVISGLEALEEKCIGDPLNLSLNVTGQVTAIRWYKDNVLQANTDLNYFIGSLALTDAGVYRCEIEGEGITVVTETTTVRVYSQTVLNAPLENKTICQNYSLDWIPDVDGTSALNYEWKFNGTPILNDKVLHYDVLSIKNEGNYEVQVTSMCGDVSTNAYLEVIELPVYISSTTGKEVCENTPLVEFSVEYAGENLKYQWRKDGVDIPDETTQTLSIAFVQIEDAGDYNCRVYSSCGEEFSPVAKLQVTPQLKVLTDQDDFEICDGEEVVLIADVEGNNVTYQWKVNGVDISDDAHISGSNTSRLTITDSKENHTGYYTCIVSDDCTVSRSTKPTLVNVNALPNTSIFGRMVLCAKEDRVTYVTIDQPETTYGWGVEGGIFAGPREGTRTRITWEEVSNGTLSISIVDLVTGCTSKVDSAVVLNALPDVSLENPGSKGVCKGEFVLTGGYPEGGIYWVNGISETVFNPSDRGAGTYAIHYSYTDEHGCSNVTPVKNMNVDVLPVVDVTDDITVGSCAPTLLTATTDKDNIQWYKIEENVRVLPSNLDNPNSKSPTFTPGESQVLLATVQDDHGCEGVDILNLTVSPLPEVTTINDTTVSQCNHLQLKTIIAGESEDVVSWTNPDHLDRADIISPTIINAPAGIHTYKLSVTDDFGCEATGVVNVTMVEDPVLGEDMFACAGETFEVNMAELENPVWSNPDWNKGERDAVNALDAYTVKTPGKYVLTVSNKFGCGDEQLFVINPKLDLGLKDTILYEGQTVKWAPNLPLKYSPYIFEWQDGSILQRFEASKTGKYKLTVEDNIGCVTVDSAYLEIKPIGIESANAFIPTAGDGDNDRFYLGFNEGVGKEYDPRFEIIEKFEMYVYDRWGELLFQTNETGYKGGWDGKYNGKDCPAGAYVWVVFINGELTNKGTFMLIR